MKRSILPYNLAIVAFLLIGLRLSGQLQVTSNVNANQLVNQLIGPGIVVSNATITTSAGASGTFLSNGSNIGLPAGVLLTSGDVVNAVGPNVNAGITTAHNSPGDVQLDVLTSPFLTFDACVLEFDMVATCDTIQISYVFGSDEYDEWVCSSFTDAFAFFISGPGIVGTQNIAVIPNSTTPVAINTVNIGTVGTFASPPYPANCNTGNSAYFTTNNTGTTVEYDGFTVPLIAKSAVQPCSTYHIKLVIADAGDASLDSGVFLEQGGIRCTSTAIEVVSSINSPGYLDAVEGCVSGRFTFVRSGDTTQAQTINYTVGGTATPAFDYPPLPGSITFPAMVSRVSINIGAFSDGINEGIETVQIILTDSVCAAVFSDTASLNINDQINIQAGGNFTICQGNTQQIGLPAQVGVAYTWIPSTSLNNGSISNPQFHNPTPGVYHYTLLGVDTSGCQGGDSMTVQVLLSPTPNFTATPDVCLGSNATIQYTGNSPANANYQWNFGGGTIVSGSGQGPYQISWATPGAHTVSLTVSQGICSSLPESHVVNVNPNPNLTLIPTNPNCFGANNGTVVSNISSGTPNFSYAWSNGPVTNNIANLGPGTYSLTVTDGKGCTDAATVTLTEPTQLTNHIDATQIICHGGTGTLAAVTAGGTPAYTYVWSQGAGTTATIHPQGGTYTVTVTDAQGCAVVESATIIDPPQIGLSITGDNILCDYEEVVLSAQLNGGVGPYHYQWTSIPAAVNDTNAVLHFDALQDRNYVLNIVDALGCTSEATFLVDAFPRPLVDFTTNIHEACDSATVTFIDRSVPANSTYLWTFVDGTTSVYQNPQHWFSNGSWGAQLTVTSPEGCVGSNNIPALVQIIPTPVASFTTSPDITLIDYLLLSQATIEFSNTSPFYAQSVNWSFGNGDSAFVGDVVYTYPAAGQYYITMTAYNQFGCHDDVTQPLLILPDPALWVPTGFTPNGDGLNDIFLVTGLELKTFAIEIYDRWGKLIFRSTDLSQGWNGNIGSEAAAEGAYVYKITGSTITGPVQKSGTITLVR